MSDQKYHPRSNRRRPQTGRVVLNRRGRILNHTPDRTPPVPQEEAKPLDELVVGFADKSVLISENDPNFTMLDQGSFMIFKANKNQENPKLDSTDTAPEKKAISSKIIATKQVDRQSSDISAPAETTPPQTDKAAAKTARKDDHLNPDQGNATVIPLRIKNRRSSSNAPIDAPLPASPKPAAEDIITQNQAPQKEATPSHADTEITPELMEPSPQQHASEPAPIENETASSEAISSDSEKPSLPPVDISAADDQMLRNWHIGAEIGATINAIVADELGQQVRRITRSVIKDMVRDGTLDLGQK